MGLVIAWIGVGVLTLVCLPLKVGVLIDIDLDRMRFGIVARLWGKALPAVWIDLSNQRVSGKWGSRPLPRLDLTPSALSSSLPLRVGVGVLKRSRKRIKLSLASGTDPFVAAMILGGIEAVLGRMVAVRSYPVGALSKGNARLSLTLTLWDVIGGVYIGEKYGRFVTKNHDRTTRLGGCRHHSGAHHCRTRRQLGGARQQIDCRRGDG